MSFMVRGSFCFSLILNIPPHLPGKSDLPELQLIPLQFFILMDYYCLPLTHFVVRLGVSSMSYLMGLMNCGSLMSSHGKSSPLVAISSSSSGSDASGSNVPSGGQTGRRGRKHFFLFWITTSQPRRCRSNHLSHSFKAISHSASSACAIQSKSKSTFGNLIPQSRGQQGVYQQHRCIFEHISLN